MRSEDPKKTTASQVRMDLPAMFPVRMFHCNVVKDIELHIPHYSKLPCQVPAVAKRIPFRGSFFVSFRALFVQADCRSSFGLL